MKAKPTTIDPSSLTLLACSFCGVPFALLTLTWQTMLARHACTRCPACGHADDHPTAGELLQAKTTRPAPGKSHGLRELQVAVGRITLN